MNAIQPAVDNSTGVSKCDENLIQHTTGNRIPPEYLDMSRSVHPKRLDLRPLNSSLPGTQSNNVPKLDLPNLALDSGTLLGETRVPSGIDLCSFRSPTPSANQFDSSRSLEHLRQIRGTGEVVGRPCSDSEIVPPGLSTNRNSINEISCLTLASPTSLLSSAPEWQTQFFKTKLCPYFVVDVMPGSEAMHGKNVGNSAGTCINGDGCRFAHSLGDLRPLPDLKKTKLCSSFARKQECLNPRCPFAHCPEELRTSSSIFYKVTLCNFYKTGKCWNGSNCRFAHGSTELRSQQYPFVAHKDLLDMGSEIDPSVPESQLFEFQTRPYGKQRNFGSTPYCAGPLPYQVIARMPGGVAQGAMPNSARSVKNRVPPSPPTSQPGYPPQEMNMFSYHYDPSSLINRQMQVEQSAYLPPSQDTGGIDVQSSWRPRQISEAVVRRRLKNAPAEKDPVFHKSRQIFPLNLGGFDPDASSHQQALLKAQEDQGANSQCHSSPSSAVQLSAKLLDELCVFLASSDVDLQAIASKLSAANPYNEELESCVSKFNKRLDSGVVRDVVPCEDSVAEFDEVPPTERDEAVRSCGGEGSSKEQGAEDEAQVMMRAIDALRGFILETYDQDAGSSAIETDAPDLLETQKTSSTENSEGQLSKKKFETEFSRGNDPQDMTSHQLGSDVDQVNTSDIYKKLLSSRTFQTDCPLSLSPVCAGTDDDPANAWGTSASSPAVFLSASSVRGSSNLQTDDSIGSLLPPGLESLRQADSSATDSGSKEAPSNAFHLLSPLTKLKGSGSIEDFDLNVLLSEIIKISSEENHQVSSPSPIATT